MEGCVKFLVGTVDEAKALADHLKFIRDTQTPWRKFKFRSGSASDPTIVARLKQVYAEVMELPIETSALADTGIHRVVFYPEQTVWQALQEAAAEEGATQQRVILFSLWEKAGDNLFVLSKRAA